MYTRKPTTVYISNRNPRRIQNKTFPLHKAIMYRNLRKIKILIESCNINEMNDAGDPGFVLACAQEDNDEMLEFLFSRDFDPTLVNKDRFTALHVLAFRGKLKWIKRLFEKFPHLEVDPRNDKKNTPLIMAAKMDHHDVIQFLFKKGADVHVQNDKSYTALFYAANSGYPKTTELLLNIGAEIDMIDNYGNTPLMKSCSWGFQETAELLIDNGANVNVINKISDTALYIAARRKHCGLVKLLLENGASVENRSNTPKIPLTSACISNCCDIVQLLVNYGADINYPGPYSEALISCVKNKSYECAEILVQLGVNIHGQDKKGSNALAYVTDQKMRNILL